MKSSIMRWGVGGWMMLAALQTTAWGAMYYVDGRATGANNGSSWADAFSDLQIALDAAIKGDEIRVGQGTYTPTVPGGNRAISFVIPNGVTLLGGFAGLGAEDPDRRDIAAYPAILSGDLNGDDVVPIYAGHLLAAPSRQDNSFHVVQVPYVNPEATTTIRGFTITGGNANGEHYTQQDGAGIEAGSNRVLIEDCVVEANSAAGSGGGCEWANLRNCRIVSNDAKWGGGVSFPRGMESCVFMGNVADFGGGMYGAVGETVYSGCQFIGNEASQGGGVYLGNEVGSFERCDLFQNWAAGDGGGIYIFNNCTCISELTLIRCRLIGNQSGSNGGAVYHEGNPRVNLYSCLMESNYAIVNGGGIFSKTYAGMRDMGYLGVTNCTIVGNDAGQQTGGLWFCSATMDYLDAVNTILWGNEDVSGSGKQEGQIRIGIGCGEPGTGEIGAAVGVDHHPVRFCCIEGLSEGFGGEGNIGEDPMFLPTLGPLPNYHLSAGSPCINTGSNAAYPCLDSGSNPGTGTWVDPGDVTCVAGLLDLDGNPRIRAGIVDMGAYEFQTAVGPILYVDDSATGTKDGSSWGDAFTKLQEALAMVHAGQEIRVAQGVYLPDDPNGNREATFQLKNNVKIRGGYAGFGAADPDARDIRAFATILSGDLNGTLPSLEPTNFYDRLMTRGRDEYKNSFHVLSAVGSDETAVLDGFVITGGTANGFVYGESADPKYYHGGGVYIESASPTLIDCTITGNIAFVYGGPAALGGGMYCVQGNPNLIRCSFIQNVTDDYDSDSYGAGMCVENGNPKLTACVFERNFTLNWGGGMMLRGFSSPVLDQCRFIGNFGAYGGGAIWATLQDIQVLTAQHCVFAGNSATGEGGGVCLRGGNAVLRNCTFASNRHYALVLESWNTAQVLVSNCIFRNGGHEILRYNGNPYVRVWNSDVEGGWIGDGNLDVDPLFADSGHWNDNGTPEQNHDDIWTDGDYHLKSQAGRWDANAKAWIQDGVTSSCIDAGDPATPIMFEPFPNGGVVNMGAYGGTAEASKSWFGKPVCEVIVAGDINGDCKVDLGDFTILAGHWLDAY